MPPRTRKTARKSTGPFGVPRHQLALQHEGSNSGSNDPIGDLEAQVDQLRAELRHRNDLWVTDGERINDLRTEIRHLQDQLADRDLALDWVVSSRSLASAKEAKAQARIEELSSAVDNLQVTLGIKPKPEPRNPKNPNPNPYSPIPDTRNIYAGSKT
jgi:hypothetical protein